jgi:hypothetical protein
MLDKTIKTDLQYTGNLCLHFACLAVALEQAGRLPLNMLHHILVLSLLYDKRNMCMLCTLICCIMQQCSSPKGTNR